MNEIFYSVREWILLEGQDFLLTFIIIRHHSPALSRFNP